MYLTHKNFNNRLFDYANPKLEFIRAKQLWGYTYKTTRITVYFAIIRKEFNIRS